MPRMAIASSRIESVTIHCSGATVRRRVAIASGGGGGSGGARDLEIPALPLSLIDATVRARVEGPGADRFTATQIRVGLHVKAREAPPAGPDAEACERLAHELRKNREMCDQLASEIEALEAVPVPIRPDGKEGSPPPPSPIVARQKLEAEIDLAIAARLAEIRSLRDAQRKLADDLREAEEKRARASKALEVRPDELAKSVHVRIHGEGEMPLGMSLLLDYDVPGARWAPAYQIRMSRDCTTADIVMRALVCQRSGEDWTSVALTLSTAEPLSWTELPELSSLRIGKVQPPPPRRAPRPAPVGAGALFSDYDRDRSKVEPLARLGAAYIAPAFASPDAPSLHRSVVASHGGGGAELTADMLSEGASFSASDEVERDAPMLRARSMPLPRAPYPAPPPQPAPPPGFGPPPAMAPAPMAPPKPAAAAASVAKPMAKRALPPTAGGARGGKGGYAAPAAEAEEASAYGPLPPAAPRLTALWLPAPHDLSGRTRLRAEEPAAPYLAGLTGLRVSFDVMATVDYAMEVAASVGSLALPPGAANVRYAAGHFDYAYPCDAPVDVPSDGAFHAVPVGGRRAESEVLYVVVPREDTSVFREAEVKNPSAAPLLPGPAEIYVAGDYVLGTSLPMVAPRGKVKLGLGVEQAIKCARNTRFHEERSDSKVVATAELIHDIEIELHNHLGRAIRCEVRERIPQPAQDAEVVVEEITVDPAWEKYEQVERTSQPLSGGRRWRIALGAGERRALSARYGIKIYANNEVVGGNRREA